jgi:hypothetical protein
VSPTDSEHNQRPHILAAADFREFVRVFFRSQTSLDIAALLQIRRFRRHAESFRRNSSAAFSRLFFSFNIAAIAGSSGADLFSNIVEPNYAIGGGNALHSICTLRCTFHSFWSLLYSCLVVVSLWQQSLQHSRVKNYHRSS